MEQIWQRLKGIDKNDIVFVGVGNDMRGDDAAGPAMIRLMKDKVPHAIDAGTTPENITGVIKRLKPKAVVFLDAVHFGEKPGSVRLVEIEDAGSLGITTHKFSLGSIMEYLRHDTGADVFMIGVQPSFIGDRRGLDKEVYETIIRIVDCILLEL